MRSQSLPRLRADVFPAVVVVAPAGSSTPATSLSRLPEDHRKVEKVRIVVTLEEVLIFQDSSKGPELIFSEPLLDYTPPPKRPSTIRTMHTPREATLQTESGKTLAFHRSTGCGCGSRLKSFNPFAATTTYAAASNLDIA
jgi:hypothetical protein